MFHDLKPYRDTTGATPPGWTRRRIKTLLTEVDRRTSTGEERLLSLRAKAGLIDHLAAGGKPITASALVGYKVVRPGELVMNRMRAATGVFGLAKLEGLVSPDYALFQLGPEVEAAYLLALLRVPAMAEQMRLRSRGMGTGESGFLRLYSDAFGAMPVTLPPIEDQRAIVTYLAHAHQRINQTIATKRRLIALHEEEARVMIAELLTGGALNASRSDGLRAIPPSWRYESAGRICTISTGVEDSGNADPDGAYPFYVRGREVLRSNDYLFDAEAVMTPGDGQGGTGKVFHYYDGKFQAHQRVYVLKDFERVLGRYFFWYMSTFFREHALSNSNTVTMESLRRPVLASFPVALPPISEQATLVERTESVRTRIVRLVEVAKREIALLEEFRTRLTADVVTGHVDVRAIAATLPCIDLEEALAAAVDVDDAVEGAANDDEMEDE